ncbi:stomatin-like protein 1 isoform X1 [Heptranchias perlo]|uniref:stomatin-like protein 1 isoform X1 n=1 Tax=Heptranchias perlo TaxID=212740 RepID=UPI00355A8140
MSYKPVPTSDGYVTDRTQSWPSFICCSILTILVFLLVVITFPITGWFVVKSVPQYERIVVFRFGRIVSTKGPGFILLLPFIDQWQKVDVRTKAFVIAPFEATIKDGALIFIGAEVHYHILIPVISVVAVQDINSTLIDTVHHVMMNYLPRKTLVTIQVDKSKTEAQLAFEINEKTKDWGLEVERVNLILHRVLKPTEELLRESEAVLRSSRRDKLTVPLRKLAMHILKKSSSGSARSPLSSAQSSAQSSESEASVQILSDEAEPEEVESILINPDWVLSKVKVLLSEELVKQIGACYLFNVSQRNGTHNLYYLDLTKDSGKAGYGIPDIDPDVTLEVTAETMQALFSGNLKPLSAYMSGRIRIHGDLKIAMKLEELIKKLHQ